MKYMYCIKCSEVMVRRIGMDIDNFFTCSKCSARWVSGEIMHQHCAGWFTDGVDETFQHFMALPIEQTTIPCPDCQAAGKERRLNLVAVDAIEVEFCSECHGVFFDFGEMLLVAPKGKYTNEWTQPQSKENRYIKDAAEEVAVELSMETAAWVIKKTFSGILRLLN